MVRRNGKGHLELRLFSVVEERIDVITKWGHQRAGELILGDVLCIYIVVLRVQTLMSIYILWGIAQQGITIYICATSNVWARSGHTVQPG